MTSIEQIERGINDLLQHNVTFALESKIVKRGRIICVR